MPGSSPPSIAIVRQRYNPFGGAERFVDRALTALARQGADVTLVTRQWKADANSLFKSVICDPAQGFSLSPRLARDRAFCQAVQQLIARQSFDIVQSHERIPGCSVFRAGDGVHAAWLAHRGAWLNPMQRLAQTLSPYHRYVLAAEKAMFEHPALRAVICNSPMVADEIHAFYGVDRAKLAIIYNGVDTEVFHPRLRDEFSQTGRQDLGIPALAPVMLYVGSGFERKGVTPLLHAFATLPGRDAHLVVVGADRKLKATRQLAERLQIADRVHFTGPVPDVRPYYGLADAFVLPTLYDPGPNAALEALACGLPMLTSEGCGAKSWVVAGQNGVVVDVASPDQLRSGLLVLLELAGSAAARRQAREAVADLTLERMAERLNGLYHSLLDKGVA